MRIFRRSVRIAEGMVFASAIAACGGGGGGGGANGNCSLAAGTYSVHVALRGASSNCPAIQDTNTTLASPEGPAAISRSMMSDAGCTTTGNGCNVSFQCMSMANGVTEQISANIAVGTNSATGTETVVVNSAGVTLDCTYDLTWTKQ